MKRVIKVVGSVALVSLLVVGSAVYFDWGTNFISYLTMKQEEMGLAPEQKVVYVKKEIRVDKEIEGNVLQITPVDHVYYKDKLSVEDFDGNLYNIGVTEEESRNVHPGSQVKFGVQFGDDGVSVFDTTWLGLSDTASASAPVNVERNDAIQTP